MLCPGGATPPLTCQDSTCRRRCRIRKCHRALGVVIGKSRAFIHTRLTFAALEIAPFIKLVALDKKLLRYVFVIDKNITKGLTNTRKFCLKFGGHKSTALHYTRILEGRCLESNAKFLSIVVGVIKNSRFR